MMNRIFKKVTTMIAAAAIAFSTFAGSFAVMTTPVQAAFLDYTLDHRADPNAPDIELSVLDDFTGKSGMVDPYAITPGKYYVVMMPGAGHIPSYKFHLVKVTKVYEDPMWYGTERTIEVTYCDKGYSGKLLPNFGIKPPHFFEVEQFAK